MVADLTGWTISSSFIQTTWNRTYHVIPGGTQLGSVADLTGFFVAAENRTPMAGRGCETYHFSPVGQMTLASVRRLT